MTDYAFPSDVVLSAAPLTWMDNTVGFYSPLSGTTRTESRPGGRWAIALSSPKTKNSRDLAKYEAFLLRLNGKQHRAIISDPAYQRQGPGGGLPAVNGASQTGLTLNTQGWVASTTVLYAGDRIGVSDQMIPVAEDVTSDGSGLATITLAHPIRTAPSNGALIEIDNPTARFIMVSHVTLDSSAGVFKTVTANFEEDIL